MTKSLADYMALPYTIEIIPDDGVCPVPGCMTEVDEWHEILPAIENARFLSQ